MLSNHTDLLYHQAHFHDIAHYVIVLLPVITSLGDLTFTMHYVTNAIATYVLQCNAVVKIGTRESTLTEQDPLQLSILSKKSTAEHIHEAFIGT